jgi:DnaJ-class molecular chaperone
MKRCAHPRPSTSNSRYLDYERSRPDSLYKVLGVSEQAKEDEILAKFEVHKKAFEVYKKAFEVLGDGKKKEEYDRERAEESKRVDKPYIIYSSYISTYSIFF